MHPRPLLAVLVCPWLLVTAGRAHGQDTAGDRSADPEPSRVEVVVDLVDRFAQERVENALEATAGSRERSGGEARPGIFLHPRPRGAAVARFDRIDVPDSGDGVRSFLLFHVGLRDGISWKTDGAGPNGVRFEVRVDDAPVFREEVAGEGWRLRAVELSGRGGENVAIELRTESIDGNSAYDWAVFGQPLLVRLVGDGDVEALREGARSLSLARVSCEAPGDVALRCGASVTGAQLEAGEHWLASTHSGRCVPRLAVTSGRARIVQSWSGSFAADTRVLRHELSSPLVHVGEALAVVVTFENRGLGRQLAGARREIRWRFRPLRGEAREGSLHLAFPALDPGDRKRQPSDSVTFDTAGTVELSDGDWRREVTVFPPRPSPRSLRGDFVGVRLDPEHEIAATVASEGARLDIVRGASDEAYGMMSVHDGGWWRPLGSIYPLAACVFASGDPGQFQLRDLKGEGDALQITGFVRDRKARDWPVSLTIAPRRDVPRLSLEATLTAPRSGGSLLAFHGPRLLPGHAAFGARKDFAIFPGLEFLAGDEPSSSRRDLAYPLSDRHSPLPFKVTTPLIAVQAGEASVALLWDMRQSWRPSRDRPGVWFDAPSRHSGVETLTAFLFAPTVGEEVDENRDRARVALRLEESERWTLRSQLALDHRVRYDADDAVLRRPGGAGMALRAFDHWFDAFERPEPSPAPRDWASEKALCRHAYFEVLWREDPPGVAHCRDWSPGPFVGHAVPLILDRREGVPIDVAARIDRHVGRLLAHRIDTVGPGALWSPAGCHIVRAELPFLRGYPAAAMKSYRDRARGILASRENDLWVWRPQSERHATLGRSGDHTLGQAATAAFDVLRAARLSGDPALRREGLEAMRQMERYAVPRGAQMWECPLRQPDILAAAYAIRARCEAYRLTGDAEHLARARYWAASGLPFLYHWEMPGYPTMRYNVISVIGSTFHSHSWLGLPVVWCGLVYAYAILDLAELDSAAGPWTTIARGILRSAMWQQYTGGPSRGCYPDSWSLAENEPRPADINPENILMTGLRLRGRSTEVDCARLRHGDGGAGDDVLVNSGGRIEAARGHPAERRLELELRGDAGFPAATLVAPVRRPATVHVDGEPVEPVASEHELQGQPLGWTYDAELRAVSLRIVGGASAATVVLRWDEGS